MSRPDQETEPGKPSLVSMRPAGAPSMTSVISLVPGPVARVGFSTGERRRTRTPSRCAPAAGIATSKRTISPRNAARSDRRGQHVVALCELPPELDHRDEAFRLCRREVVRLVEVLVELV